MLSFTYRISQSQLQPYICSCYRNETYITILSSNLQNNCLNNQSIFRKPFNYTSLQNRIINDDKCHSNSCMSAMLLWLMWKSKKHEVRAVFSKSTKLITNFVKISQLDQKLKGHTVRWSHMLTITLKKGKPLPPPPRVVTDTVSFA
jgi:hypothetical protein